MPSFSEIEHNFIIPAALGLVVTFLKIIAEGKDPNFDECNGIALDLILVAFGTAGIYLAGKPGDVITAGWVGNLVLATILLLIRYVRQRKAAKLTHGHALPITSWWFGTFQLILGVLALVWIVNAK